MTVTHLVSRQQATFWLEWASGVHQNPPCIQSWTTSCMPTNPISSVQSLHQIVHCCRWQRWEDFNYGLPQSIHDSQRASCIAQARHFYTKMSFTSVLHVSVQRSQCVLLCRLSEVHDPIDRHKKCTASGILCIS